MLKNFESLISLVFKFVYILFIMALPFSTEPEPCLQASSAAHSLQGTVGPWYPEVLYPQIQPSSPGKFYGICCWLNPWLNSRACCKGLELPWVWGSGGGGGGGGAGGWFLEPTLPISSPLRGYGGTTVSSFSCASP